MFRQQRKKRLAFLKLVCIQNQRNGFLLMFSAIMLVDLFFYSESIVVYDDTKVEEKYLSLEELGNVLENLGVQLSCKLVIIDKRIYENYSNIWHQCL